MFSVNINGYYSWNGLDALVFMVINIFYRMMQELLLRIRKKATEFCEACPLYVNQIWSGNHTCFLVSHSCFSRGYDALDLAWFCSFSFKVHTYFFSFLEATAVLVCCQTAKCTLLDIVFSGGMCATCYLVVSVPVVAF